MLNSAVAAVAVCGGLALGVALSGYMTPRLTGRLHGDPASLELASDGPGPGIECVSTRSQGEDQPADARDERLLALPPVLGQLLPLGNSPAAPRLTGPVGPLPTGEDDQRRLAPKDGASPTQPTAERAPEAAPPSRPTPDRSVASAPAETPRRIRVRMPAGQTVIARVHGTRGGETHVMLPDGRLAIADTLAYSPEPFRPATPDEVLAELTSGPFAGFASLRTDHYLVLYQSTKAFADESGRVLEDLYHNLLDAFRKRDVPVHDAEFPLVAVIFRTEADFRAHRRVDPAIQAYYEIYTNRIYFHEESKLDEQAPEVAAVRRPQTVAHEGTHQVLQNIGVQPRLAEWPAWLVEGLAEYCAAPQTTRRGAAWAGLGVVNAQHLATIRDLDDPLSVQVPGTSRPEHIGRPRGMPLVEYLVTKSELTPTDYALAWAMTHYLAMKRVDEFVDYLRSMSQMPPLGPRSGADHLAAFRDAFGSDLAKLDREIGSYLSRLKVKDHLPYYSVMFQQRVSGGVVRRAAIVSQSPSMIRQWLDTVTSPRGSPPEWSALPFPSRTRAYLAAQEFVQGL